MSEGRLTIRQAAERLNCPRRTVRAMLRGGLLAGEKVKGRWRVEAVRVEDLRALTTSAPPSLFSRGRIHRSITSRAYPCFPNRMQKLISLRARRSAAMRDIDPGMVEVSITLAGLAGAIAALLPDMVDLMESARLLVAVGAGAVSVLSSYSALWLLARYRLKGKSPEGLREIAALLSSPGKVGPYWLLALGLLVWLVLSILIICLAVHSRVNP